MKAILYFVVLYSLTSYSYGEKKCPGRCDAVRCAWPECKTNEMVVPGDSDCICCPYCEECPPYLCAATLCLAVEESQKRCKSNERFVLPDGICNCCGKCEPAVSSYDGRRR